MQIINCRVVNNNIWALNDFLVYGRPKTYLNSSLAAGVGAITVFSISGFVVGNYYVLIGGIGAGNSELVKIHASTAPTGTTITLAANTVNAHDANEPVYFVLFNQWDFYNAPTIGGVKSATGLGKKAIDPTKKWTICSDATNTSGYAFVQPYNSAGTSTPYGALVFSAGAPYANADWNTVEYICNEALRETKQSYGEDENGLTPDYLLSQINECLRDIRRSKKKVSWTQSFAYDLGQTARGVFRYSLPTDIYDKYNFGLIEGIRLGGQQDLNLVTPEEFFNEIIRDLRFTQVRTAAGVGDTTLEINNSYDFEDSGTITVGSQTITYTGVTRSATAGVLTGIPASGTGSITAVIAIDDFIFQNAVEGKPTYATIFNGYLWIYELPNSTWDNYNIKIDYFKTITKVSEMSDVIDYLQYDLIKNWLKWKIHSFAKNDGVDDLQDSSFLLYSAGKKELIQKDRVSNIKSFRNNYEFGEEDDDTSNPRKQRDG
jgi:hypothetical protein